MQLSEINVTFEFKQELQELYRKYYKQLNCSDIDQIIKFAISLTLEILDKNNKFKHILSFLDDVDNGVSSIFKEEYPQLYMNYAANNLYSDGFFGLLKIPLACKTDWVKIYPRWTEAVDTVPGITANLLNKSFNELIKDCEEDPKLKSMLLNKAIDVIYRTNKETGQISEDHRGLNAAKRSSKPISEDNINVNAF